MAGLGTSPPPTARRFAPTPVETTVKKVRRFAVEPVETTSRSNRREEAQKVEDSNTATQQQKLDVPTKRRFAPEPIETTTRSSRQAAASIPTPETTPTDVPEQVVDEKVPKPRRKFVPELIETLKRSKRAGDARPATLPTDKTDLTPGVPNIYTKPAPRPHPSPSPPYNTSINSSNNIQQHHFHPPLPRRQGSMKPHCNTRRSTRQNSFQPELDVILSDPNSEEEDKDSIGHTTPSLSRSFGSSDDSDIRLQMARTRESCDDRFSGYLLELAAKAAEKQLREQALAAFPNENFHETVEHFYDREIEGQSDAGSVEGVGALIDDEDDLTLPLEIRRKSTAEPGWDVREMQQHQETLQRMREDETNVKIAEEASRPSFHDPFWTNGMTTKFAQQKPKVAEPRDPIKEKEMAKMRSAASPPMLGGDLTFRMCPSPKATKFESDQKPDIQLKKSETGGGLWGGYCVTDEADQYLSPAIERGPMLLQTPQVERDDPFASAFTAKLPTGARSPRTYGVGMLTGLDDRLQKELNRSKAEEALLAEFDDAFVTQVYNYLSLGYPSLAYQYDEELAKIARVPEVELSADDSKKQAKGYLGITQASGEVTEQVKDKRWLALKVYIMEWAKQHPSLNEDGRDLNAWGVRARRGSWAI